MLVKVVFIMAVCDESIMVGSWKHTENEKATNIGGESADKETIIEHNKCESHTGDNSEPQTNAVSATGEVAMTNTS